MKSPRLARGVISTLKDYGKLNASEISECIGWRPDQVTGELRRLKDKTILGLWLNETKTPKKGTCFEMDKTFRNGVSVDCLYDMALKTFKFNPPLVERL